MTVALVAGAVANKPGNGGAAWTRLSWAKGLRELGFDVHLVEQLAEGAGELSERWFDDVLQFGGMGGQGTLLRPDGSTAVGLALAELLELAAEAALLINISGHLTDPALFGAPARTVFVDLDPGYTQIWHLQGLAPLRPHDHFYTVGLHVGTPQCSIPSGGVDWRHTLQPVVLSDWPAQPPASFGRLTTVGAWRGPFGPVQHEGAVLGPKAHQLRRFLDLPSRAPGLFEIALDIDEADRKDRSALEEHGWRLSDPAVVAGTPGAFRSYVQGSGAEFSVAQSVYVRTGSGWFSDRTVRYLSSGRPAVVQDTGFSSHVPTGEGLLTFTTAEDAVLAVEVLAEDYRQHCDAARTLAERHFAADLVLGRLCEEVGVAP